MWMRKISLLFCSLILVIMTACSSGSGGDAKTVEPGKAEEAVNAPAEATNEQPTNESTSEEDITGTPEMDFDMGGSTIKWVSWYDESIQEDNPDNINRKRNLEDLMEKHNFKMEYVTVDFGEYQDKVTASLVAGEPIGDIIRVARPWMIPTLVNQGLFAPVDEYTKNEKVFIQQYTNEYSQYEGRGYGFRTGINGASSGIFYNRTLMNQLGMKPLQEYVNEDKWNWDTFIQVAKEANKDSNNDGKLIFGVLQPHHCWFLQWLRTKRIWSFSISKDSRIQNLEVLNFLSRLATEAVGRPTEGETGPSRANFSAKATH